MSDLFYNGGRLPNWPFGELQPHYYQLLEVDPPWRFELYSEAGNGKSASAHYKTMSLEEIQALPMGELADPSGCLVLLWTIAPLLPEAIETLQRWGFRYVTWMHWRKVTKNGKPSMGTGYRVRSMGELVLLADKGKPRHKPFRGDLPGERRRHSEKPAEFKPHIEARCSGLIRRAEIFSRTDRPGWDAWGDEAGKFNEVPA